PRAVEDEDHVDRRLRRLGGGCGAAGVTERPAAFAGDAAVAEDTPAASAAAPSAAGGRVVTAARARARRAPVVGEPGVRVGSATRRCDEQRQCNRRKTRSPRPLAHDDLSLQPFVWPVEATLAQRNAIATRAGRRRRLIFPDGLPFALCMAR